MADAVASPNKPRPSGVTLEIADMLMRIERNYQREGSGPGSLRFEGRLLEDVQAESVLRRIRQLAESVGAVCVIPCTEHGGHVRAFTELLGDSNE